MTSSLPHSYTWLAKMLLKFDGDDKKLEKVIVKFEIYCMPRKNVTWERHIFNTRDQQPGETIDQYATDLRKKAKSCEFGTLTESLITDRIVCGVLSDRTRSRLLKKPDLTLESTLDICRADETTSTQMKSLASSIKMPSSSLAKTPSSSDDIDLNFVGRRDQQKTKYRTQGQTQGRCRNCGYQHSTHQRLPAFGTECYNCGRRNHLSNVCRAPPRKAMPKVQELKQNSSSEDDMLVAAITSKAQAKSWNATLKIHSRDVKFKPLSRSKAGLVAFGGQRITPVGKAVLLCEPRT